MLRISDVHLYVRAEERLIQDVSNLNTLLRVIVSPNRKREVLTRIQAKISNIISDELTKEVCRNIDALKK